MAQKDATWSTVEAQVLQILWPLRERGSFSLVVGEAPELLAASYVLWRASTQKQGVTDFSTSILLLESLGLRLMREHAVRRQQCTLLSLYLERVISVTWAKAKTVYYKRKQNTAKLICWPLLPSNFVCNPDGNPPLFMLRTEEWLCTAPCNLGTLHNYLQ